MGVGGGAVGVEMWVIAGCTPDGAETGEAKIVLGALLTEKTGTAKLSVGAMK